MNFNVPFTNRGSSLSRTALHAHLHKAKTANFGSPDKISRPSTLALTPGRSGVFQGSQHSGSRLSEQTISSAMKKKDLATKSVKFNQEFLSGKKPICFTQRNSNTPGQFNSGMRPKENKVPTSFSAKPFCIPGAAPSGRRSIMNDQTNRGSLPPAAP